MRFSKRLLLRLLVVLTLAHPALLLAKKDKHDQVPSARLDEQKRALHALNRVTFGPRPQDVQRVLQMGVEQWIELQPHPEKIDDKALEARLTPLRTLRMSTRDIVQNFPPPQTIKTVAEGGEALPSDPSRRAIYQAQLERYQARQERKQDPQSGSGEATGKPDTVGDDQRAHLRQARLNAEAKVEEILELPPDKRMAEILKLPTDQQRALARLPEEQKDSIMASFTPQQRETLMAIQNPQQVVANELMAGCYALFTAIGNSKR